MQARYEELSLDTRGDGEVIDLTAEAMPCKGNDLEWLFEQLKRAGTYRARRRFERCHHTLPVSDKTGSNSRRRVWIRPAAK